MALTNIDVPGAQDAWATGINELGDIVGFYQDRSGNYEAFLATLPLTAKSSGGTP
jgi:hypothetical protein